MRLVREVLVAVSLAMLFASLSMVSFFVVAARARLSNASPNCSAISWWTIDPASGLEFWISDFANTVTDFNPDMIELVASIYTGDHGKGKLCFGAKLVLLF